MSNLKKLADPSARCCDGDEKPKSLDPESDCFDWRFQGKIDANGKCVHTAAEPTAPATMFDDEPTYEPPPVFDGALSAQMMKIP